MSAAAGPFAAWALEPAADFAALSPEERLRHLAGWALLAPSTHNTVPVRFRLAEGALELRVDRQAVLPESDPAGRQAAISVGCAVQNAVLAAAAYGFAAEVAVEASSAVRPFTAGEPRHAKVASVRLGAGQSAGPRSADDAGTRAGGASLSAGPPPERGWLEAMRARRMVRAEYDGRQALDPALAESLRQAAMRIHPGLSLHLLADAPTRIALGK